jgi:hypothetical protein
MFEFRLRILDVREHETDPFSYLGIVEGFPDILAHSTSVGQVEKDLMNAIAEHLKRLRADEATRIDWDEFPTARVVRLCVSLKPG